MGRAATVITRSLDACLSLQQSTAWQSYGSGGGAARLSRHGLLELEHLEPVVPRVHRDHPVALVHGHRPGVRQVAWGAALGAPDLQALAGLLVDQLHPVIPELAHDEMAVPVLAQAVGPAELAQSRADRAHVADERAVGLEDGDAVVRRIC